MASFKLTTVAALVSLISAQELTTGSPDLFTLQEDQQIIAPTATEPEKDIFTMDQDTFIPVPDQAVPKTKKDNKAKKKVVNVDYKASDDSMAAQNMKDVWSILDSIQKPHQKKERIYSENTPLFDEDDSFVNELLPRNSTKIDDKHASYKISDNRRPVYAVLTEPIRGSLKNNRDNEDVQFDHTKDEISYVPKAHVQFLEQSCVVVVPISYTLSPEEIKAELKKVNGVYFCGDSERAVGNNQFQSAFDTIMDFVVTSNKKQKVYFPMFMMGKSHHSFLKKLGLSTTIMKDMDKYRNTNVKVDLVKDYNDTFLLHQLQFDDSDADAFTLGDFFNRQHTGFRIKDLEMDERLSKWISPIATFSGSGDIAMEKMNNPDLPYDRDLEFIAIAEGKDLPLYMFTYNVEMTQFSFTDMMKNPEQVECVDKSLLSRHHAQFISH